MNKTTRRSVLYKGHRFPPLIISHCVWVYFRFCLSFRDVSELLLARGIEVSHEAVRFWTLKFGGEYSRRLRARQPQWGDTWHLDEVFCKVNGALVYLVACGGVRSIKAARSSTSCSAKAEQESGDALLSEAAQGSALPSARRSNRSPQELRRSADRGDAWGFPSAGRATEQSRGELPSSDTRAGA